MSFNRGMKRDSFGNRNFNNRPIGGGSMNPWEGGMMPGRGILPTPNNNLSLASPQAQLAIASNLLSNLLRSQQETQPQVPSLLSLGNAFGGPGPNFRNQQNFIPGRFNDRQMRRPLDTRRPEPYNKMGNRARDGPAGRRGPSAQQSRAAQSGNQRINGNQNQHRNDKSSKPIPASKQNQAAKKEQQDVKTSDNEKAETPVVKSEEIEESEEKKRDWKDEKKEGEATQIGKTEKTDASKDQQAVQSDTAAGTAEAPKEGDSSIPENEPKTPGKKSAARHAESRYADVPMNKMVCHVCNKHMWDGYSFENHLRGRAHLLMMDKLDESYKLKVDLMRHELRVAEEQRELSLSNSKRRGKKVSVDLNVREYCTMCDLNFYGTLSTHRKSEKHQQLKTFLHPRCFACMKEFPSRIEYDEHCLTPLHMKSAVQSEEQRKNKKKDKLAKGESEVRSAEEEEKESAATEMKADKDEELPENAEYLTDIVENVTDPKYKIPSYKHCRQNQLLIGKSMVKEVQGYYCEKCHRFMLTSEDMTVHLRSINHYRTFVQEVKALISSAENVEAKPTEETEGSEKDTSKDNEEYEGNWKRRKVAHSEDEDANESKETHEPNDGIADEATKPTEGDDKYDPMEADVESEDEVNRDEEENQLLEGTENQQDEEKKTTDEKMWADIDNDNDLEIGNLLDEIADEKDATADSEESPKKESGKVVETETKAPRGRGAPRSRGNRARRSRR